MWKMRDFEEIAETPFWEQVVERKSTAPPVNKISELDVAFSFKTIQLKGTWTPPMNALVC